MSYEEIPPRRELRSFVECFWTLRPDPTAAAAEQRILPDGCVDILFEDGAAKVVGAMTSAVVLARRPRGDIVAVRFRPGGAAPLLGVPMSEIADRHADLGDLWRGAREVAARVVEPPCSRERVAALEDELMLRAARAPAVDARVSAAVAAIAASRGRLAIAALAARVGVTRQHLARLFDAHVGHGPKLFARVARLRALIEAVERAGSLDWAGAALDAGYFDQAHMIAEFRALAGVTPGRYFHVPNLQSEAAAAG